MKFNFNLTLLSFCTTCLYSTCLSYTIWSEFQVHKRSDDLLSFIIAVCKKKQSDVSEGNIQIHVHIEIIKTKVTALLFRLNTNRYNTFKSFCCWCIYFRLSNSFQKNFSCINRSGYNLNIIIEYVLFWIDSTFTI